MADTPAGTTLTEQHRVSQLAIAAQAQRELLTLWPLLNPAKLDQTTRAWIAAVLTLITKYRSQSAARALSYYRAFRLAETGSAAGIPDIVVPPLNEVAAQTSMLVTGPVQIKTLVGHGYGVEEAQRSALVSTAKAVQRRVLSGGRDSLLTAVNTDRRALGWIRVTDGDPCAFCALMASRGPVYRSRETATQASGRRGPQAAGQPYHDGCGCTAEPVYSRTQAWPPGNRGWAELYRRTTGNVFGKEKLIAFRAAYNAAQKDGGQGAADQRTTAPPAPSPAERAETDRPSTAARTARAQRQSATGQPSTPVPDRPAAAAPSRTAQRGPARTGPAGRTGSAGQPAGADEADQATVPPIRPNGVERGRDLAARFEQGHTVELRLAGGQSGSTTEKVRLIDGTQAVRKRESQFAEGEALHEYLASLVADALGIDGVDTAMLDEHTTLTLFSPGVMGGVDVERSGAPEREVVLRHTRMRNAREIGLLDFLVANADRNEANYLIAGDVVHPIDHGAANFAQLDPDSTDIELDGPFARAWLRPDGDVNNRDDVSPADLVSPYNRTELAALRIRLQPLETEFRKRGGEAEWRFLMQRLALLEAVAR